MARREDVSLYLVVGFFAGTAIGVMAALLFAPTSGRRLRRQLAREGRRLGETVSDEVGELRERGEDVYKKGREALLEAAKDLRKVAEETRDAAAAVIKR